MDSIEEHILVIQFKLIKRDSLSLCSKTLLIDLLSLRLMLGDVSTMGTKLRLLQQPYDQ